MFLRPVDPKFDWENNIKNLSQRSNQEVIAFARSLPIDKFVSLMIVLETQIQPKILETIKNIQRESMRMFGFPSEAYAKRELIKIAKNHYCNLETIQIIENYWENSKDEKVDYAQEYKSYSACYSQILDIAASLNRILTILTPILQEEIKKHGEVSVTRNQCLVM